MPVLSRERAADLVSRIAGQPPPFSLIATRRLSEPTRAFLRSAAFSWAEQSTGALRLAAPGLLVEVTRPDSGGTRSDNLVRAKLRGRSGWIAETLLLRPLHETIRLPELARASGVSPALTSRILTRLSALGLVETRGAGPYRTWRLLDRGGLLDLWANEESVKPARLTALYVWSRSPHALLEKIRAISAITEHWALGGAAAANLYQPTLTVDPAPTIWIDAGVPAEDVARSLGGSLTEQGANMFVHQIEHNLPLRHAVTWSGRGNLRVVSRPRAYLESLVEGGRSAEVAQKVREEVVGGHV